MDRGQAHISMSRTSYHPPGAGTPAGDRKSGLLSADLAARLDDKQEEASKPRKPRKRKAAAAATPGAAAAENEAPKAPRRRKKAPASEPGAADGHEEAGASKPPKAPKRRGKAAAAAAAAADTAQGAMPPGELRWRWRSLLASVAAEGRLCDISPLWQSGRSMHCTCLSICLLGGWLSHMLSDARQLHAGAPDAELQAGTGVFSAPGTAEGQPCSQDWELDLDDAMLVAAAEAAGDLPGAPAKETAGGRGSGRGGGSRGRGRGKGRGRASSRSRSAQQALVSVQLMPRASAPCAGCTCNS